ncbi:MAG: DUF998 domain-containing protein [Spirochaetales bacterium]|nr:DUF998 domain-containing protein [Spirochaetales bacterium]
MIIIAVIVFVVFIIIAHVFAPKGYSWTADTVSRLADPVHPYAWILRIGMISYGIILIAGTRDYSLSSILIAIYGFGVITTGVFTVKKHERIHMFSIYAAGAALLAAMFRHAITGDIISILCLVSMISSELVFNIKYFARWRGLSQRIVHLSSLIWLAAHGAV